MSGTMNELGHLRSEGAVALEENAYARTRQEPAALQLKGIRRVYEQGRVGLEVLKGADLVLHPGEAVALVGPSGAGKSTLLHISGLLERPSAGFVFISGADCTALGDGERTAIRRREIGFVYQQHRLLPEFSALENVMMPGLIAGTNEKKNEGKGHGAIAPFGAGRPAWPQTLGNVGRGTATDGRGKGFDQLAFTGLCR